jgi:PAS domain S-box-containing protein
LHETPAVGLVKDDGRSASTQGGRVGRGEHVYSYDMELMPDGSLRAVRVDEALLTLWGYTLEELAGDGWVDLVPPQDMDFIENLLRIVREGRVWTGRIRTYSRDGSIRIFAVHLEPEILSDRTLVRAIARDVTDAALQSLSLEVQSPSRTIAVGELNIDPDGYIVTKREAEISLTITEFKLLLEFVRNPGRVLTQRELAERVWGHDFISSSNVPMAVKRLRDKIEDDPREPTLIETVRGVGYRLRSPVG